MRTAAAVDAHNNDDGRAQQAAVALDVHNNEVDAHISDDDNCSGRTQQRQRQLRWTRTTTTKVATVDAHSTDGGCAEQRCQREQHEEDETTTRIRGNQWLAKRNAKKIIYFPNFKP
ncbi:hypothetical protein DEO72_LG4g967 [Vigna unguiculata]|uniref:Uncharacterized protein n=1 Tax=Vigna unguiculata TaxID=3917 RepID=A0A4D6LNR5_VIGUN|nr:hypothetical protein DEO72_LG4g967 [Vigna unguiculata]